MLSFTLRGVQVMDSWALVATLREDHNMPEGHDYSSSSLVLPLTDEEDQADALTAVRSAIQRWVVMTSL